MNEEIIIDYKKECSNLLAEKNALLCRYEEIREQLKQAENTVNECHKYLAELEDKIDRLEQENKDLKVLLEVANQKNIREGENTFNLVRYYRNENRALKDNINHLQAIIDDGRAENKRFREENKELKTCIEMIKNTEGQAHIEGVRLAKENKELKEEVVSFMNGDYCANGCKKMNNAFCDAHTAIINENKNYRSALEEIKKIAKDIIENDVYENSDVKAEMILDKINEVLS